MKNSKANFVLSLLFSALIFFSCGVKVPYDISTPTEIIHYSNVEKVHSRAITSNESELLIAASDGVLYIYNTLTKSTSTSLPSPKKEYRDLVLNGSSILLLAVGDTSLILNQGDQLLPSSTSKEFNGVFLDGVDYKNNTYFLMGDPTNGKFNLYKSTDKGLTWNQIENAPIAHPREAGFAASGTNVKVINDQEFLFVSGGDSSRFFRTTDAGLTWSYTSMGFKSCATCGAYSFTITKNNTIIAVGGDYLQPNEGSGTCRISKDGGRTWFSPKQNPNGYRSNITEIKGVLYTCGTNGIDYSIDNGQTWFSFAKGNYFTLCEFQNNLAASTIGGNIHLFNQLK